MRTQWRESRRLFPRCSSREWRSRTRRSKGLGGSWCVECSTIPSKIPDMTLMEFRKTRVRIQPYIRTTPTVPCDIPDLWLKLENLQLTHSFKIRGGFARVMELIEAGDRRTILTV